MTQKSLKHYEKTNTNIAFSQAGSQGASQEGLVVGARSGNPYLFSPEHVRFALSSAGPETFGVFDHFIGKADARWAIDNTGTEAIQTGHGGILGLITAEEIGDSVTLALGLGFEVGKGLIVLEAAVQIPTALDDTVLEVGFSDALTETAGRAFAVATVAGVDAVATDAIVVAFDETGDAAFNVLSVNDGTEKAVTSGVAVVADKYYVIRIEIDTVGTARVFVDGVLTSTVVNAVAVESVLTPWVSVVTLVAAAAQVNVDYVGVVSQV